LDLLVDIGNTSLKWSPCEWGGLGAMRAVRHHGAIPIDLHAAWDGLPRPARVLVASVAPRALTLALDAVCRSRWGLAAELVRVDPRLGGVRPAYAEPRKLGVDRWLALIAARRRSPGPALIVDAGTAVTYDLLLADGRHLGGLILPGIEMMRDSLLAGTNVPRLEPAEAPLPWAADTASGIGIGSIEAPAALAERLLARLAATAGQTPTLLLTGGDAERLRPSIAAPLRVAPDLVLEGLSLLRGEWTGGAQPQAR
jgi:type III pantothenate kinase